jgi:quinoprotein glucose dehydrogenase
MKNQAGIIILVFSCLFLSCKKHHTTAGHSGWETYAGAKDGDRYSSNDQITAQNVKQLQVAWTYSTNDKDSANRSQIECNPIMVDGILYGTSPRLKLFALNAATGRQQWVFDPASVDLLAG